MFENIVDADDEFRCESIEPTLPYFGYFFSYFISMTLIYIYKK